MAQIVTLLMNLTVRMEREQFLAAGRYERVPERRGYANGSKPKLIDTPAGTLNLDVPISAGTDEPYYPQALERGTSACRAPAPGNRRTGFSVASGVWILRALGERAALMWRGRR